MKLPLAALATALFSSAVPATARASGHGPVYGLATPTLGEGGWSVDVSAMYRLNGDISDGNAQRAMLRPMLAYGITEDLQLSVSAPMPLYVPSVGGMGPGRVMAMMPVNADTELLLAWRFTRNGNDVGSRIESTALAGFAYPTDAVRGGVRTSPGLLAGAVTGYASRSIYLWGGALYRRYMSPTGAAADHPGDALLYSLVFGYRPDFFRKELPHPDWRVFVEAVGEYTGKDRAAGRDLDTTGGHEIFVGPTLLGLYGPWGISGGPLFPVYSRLNGNQRGDRVRFAVNYTYWF